MYNVVLQSPITGFDNHHENTFQEETKSRLCNIMERKIDKTWVSFHNLYIIRKTKDYKQVALAFQPA